MKIQSHRNLGLSLLLSLGLHLSFFIGDMPIHPTPHSTQIRISATISQSFPNLAEVRTQGNIATPSEHSATPAYLLTDVSAIWESLGISQPGKVSLNVHINTFGHATKIDVLYSTFPRAVEGEIVNLFYQAEYAPARENGRPVPTIAEFAIENL